MASIQVVTLENAEAGSVELHDKIAEAELSPFVIKDAVVANMASKRSGNHKAKGRSEVAGSRKKLFRQKGTGNARQGTKQAPHHRHGGVAFGPVVRDHSIKINKKVRKKALASVIGEKIRQNQMLVIEDVKLESPKTKELVAKLQALNIQDALVVVSEPDKNFELASRNLQSIKTIQAGNLNVYDVLSFTNLVFTKSALQDVEGRLLQ